MTLVQSYHCKRCNYGFGPIGVEPYEPERPQVFRYCRACSSGQSLFIEDPKKPLVCADCGSTHLDDVQEKCPVCGSPDVEWSEPE